MFIVIFRARIRSFDAEYSRLAERMRALALGEFARSHVPPREDSRK